MSRKPACKETRCPARIVISCPATSGASRTAATEKVFCAELRVNAHGFSLQAAVRWRADQRAELEHLCRYITRPAIANEQLKRNRAGQVVAATEESLQRRHHLIVMEPLEFMECLATLVPRPRRFHGVLGQAVWPRVVDCR